MRIVRFLAAGAALALLTAPGLGAFSDSGHRIVGLVAELHLRNTRALAEVRKILRPGESLADAALWLDTIKNPAFDDGDAAPFRLEHPGHEVYHYTNVAFQEPRYDAALPGAHAVDIVRMTRECVAVLRGTSRTFTRREALRLLAHFVGDIHQPMHVGNAFVSSDNPLRFVKPEGPGWRATLGGNLLRYGPQDSFSLHSYWDAHVVNLAMRQLDVTTYAERLVQEMPVQAQWRNAGDAAVWPEEWATEVLEYAREAHKGVIVVAYLGPDESGRVPHRWRIRLPPGYDDVSRSRVRTQLAKAGYRLSAVLTSIWP